MKNDKVHIPFEACNTDEDFTRSALECFRFQSVHNPLYREYIKRLDIKPKNISEVKEIPFLPIEFFKSHRVFSGEGPEQTRFLSSGTTGMQRAVHYVASLEVYEESFTRCFELFYGRPEEYCFLALLPSYLESSDSSLVYMAGHFIKQSRFPESGFCLDDLEGLIAKITSLEGRGVKTILLGVSFALLELARDHPVKLRNTIVIETGGMKGRGEELSREELHGRLAGAFGLKKIHSEYGMTELMSQAYSTGSGLYRCPPWMRVLVRDPYDPFNYPEHGRSGGLNIIDLANRYSCAFLETQDLGRVYPDGSFEVLGRFDNSDIRGCNLLIQ